MGSHIFVPHRRIFLGYVDVYPPFFRRKFQRIGKQVQKDLVQPHIIAIDAFRQDILDENIKMLFS